MTIIIRTAGGSDIGRARRRNEDSAFVGRYVYAVADGLGGHVAGDVASATVIEALRPYDVEVDEADLIETLGRAVAAANALLGHRIRTTPETSGMGTTLVAMLQSGATAALVNIGDSRAYLLRGGEFRSITEDHVYGKLISDAADVPQLPAKLARWLDGQGAGRSPDLSLRDLRPGDRYLLCSDGLSSFVTTQRIKEVLTSTADARSAVEELIDMANGEGGRDNITLIIADVQEGVPSATTAPVTLGAAAAALT